jgi:hypothetical protein
MVDGRKKIEVSREQILYANILYYGSLVGIVLMVISFAIYVSGTLPPFIDYDKLPELWVESTHHLIEETGLPTGWGWISMVGYGDFLNLLMLAFLAMLTIICYITVLPEFIKKREWIFATIAVAEIAILLLAASGILQTGH